jgi:NodT family efflux transporter outer membrane factor (OMF) lipoprotein
MTPLFFTTLPAQCHSMTSAFSSALSVLKRPGRLALVCASVLLSACADFSGITPMARALLPESLGLRAVPLPAAASPAPAGGASAATASKENNFDQNWWRSFQDPRLDALVSQALESHPSLKAAQTRIARAQAVIEAQGANDKVQSLASLDATQQRFSAVGMYPPPLAGGVYQTANVQMNLSYEWDLFGKNRAALDAAIGASQAAIADAQQARLLLSTQVTRTYLAMVRLQAQRALQQQYLAQRAQTNAIGKARKDAGLDSDYEFLTVTTSMAEIRQQIEALGEQIALSRNALAALSGKARLDLDVPDDAMAALHASPVQDSVPMDLLGRRPDIVAARWRVEAAGADMAYAKTLFYPNINLTAFVGLNSVGWGNITHAGSEQWGLGPALRLPVFETGRLRANLHGKSAELDGAIESYNALVLEAVRDVSEQLSSLQGIAKQQREQQLAQANAQALLHIAQQRFAAGLVTRSAVINAQSALVPHQRQAIELQGRALDVQAQLLRALGGGYGSTHTVGTASAASNTTP